MPHDIAYARGMQMLQCPYYIVMSGAEEPEEAMQMYHNPWFAVKKREIIMKIDPRDPNGIDRIRDKIKMSVFNNPWRSNAFVLCNRDLALCFLMAQDFITPKYNNLTEKGVPWAKRPYVKPIRAVLNVKFHFFLFFMHCTMDPDSDTSALNLH